jgi:hypothetical protein
MLRTLPSFDSVCKLLKSTFLLEQVMRSGMTPFQALSACEKYCADLTSVDVASTEWVEYHLCCH